MGKMAYVSVTYLFSFEPKDLNLNENCDKDEFYELVSKKMEDLLKFVRQETDMCYNDLEITIE